MKYELKAPLKPTSVFTEDYFQIGNKVYQYSNVTRVTSIGKAGALTNGLIQLYLDDGSSVSCVYDVKHKTEGEKVIEYLCEIVSNKEERALKQLMHTRKAQELYEFCCKFGYGSGYNDKWGVKHFQLLVDSLLPGEQILFPFIGIRNFQSMSKHEKHFAYAVTNKRIVCAQKKVVGQIVQSVSWNNVNDVTLKSGIAFGVVTIDTFKETFNVAITPESAQKVFTKIHTTFEEMKNGSCALSSSDPYDSLKKLKELQDAGIISTEEFDAKKKQLLGLL